MERIFTLMNKYFHSLIDKIDIYMKHHVEPMFDLESIRWWFSLSGGKDSFAMTLAIKNWYEERGKKLDAIGFHISQWSELPVKYIQKQLPWLKFFHIDGQVLTQNRIRYSPGEQAPCRECADIRRELNDQLILNCVEDSSKVDFLARGLHLTDTIVSLLWRRALGYQPVHNLISKGKGRPLGRLWEGVYLSKPLYYAREFETQDYAMLNGFKACCCGCPACKFPSRRDIVEETIVPFFGGSLWEFSTPDIFDLFSAIENGPSFYDVFSKSLPGKETKIPHLPADFHKFVVNYYRRKIKEEDLSWILPELDFRTSLDSIGRAWLLGKTVSYKKDKKIPAPNLLHNGLEIDERQAMLISALGPFWGASGLSDKNRAKALSIQESIFGIKFDDYFTHSNELLKRYYWRGTDDTSNRENLDFSLISFSHDCFCSY